MCCINELYGGVIMKKFNKKMYQSDGNSGHSLPRIWASKDGDSLTVKCGCCDEKVKIIHFDKIKPEMIEINGVLAAKETWREILRF